MLQLLTFFITLCYLLLLVRIILGFVVQYMTMQGNGAPEVLVRLYDVVFSLTEPVLGPIRRMLPQTGMIDFSPLVVMIVLVVVQYAPESVVSVGSRPVPQLGAKESAGVRINVSVAAQVLDGGRAPTGGFGATAIRIR